MSLLYRLGAADGSERSTVTELQERLQLSQSAVTELVLRAEQAGLIERQRSARDARVSHLKLYREGERRLSRAFRGHQGEREHLTRIIAELERSQ